MEMKFSANEYRNTVLCIDSYDDSVLKGRFYNPYLAEGLVFTSATDFLIKMENMLDEMHFPEPFNAVRTFAPKGAFEKVSAKENKPGKLATFGVKVLFRQNASWQGSVSWLEGDSEQSFRSFMELLLLIDGACKAK